MPCVPNYLVSTLADFQPLMGCSCMVHGLATRLNGSYKIESQCLRNLVLQEPCIRSHGMAKQHFRLLEAVLGSELFALTIPSSANEFFIQWCFSWESGSVWSNLPLLAWEPAKQLLIRLPFFDSETKARIGRPAVHRLMVQMDTPFA